jgi:hypothetical protein
VGEVRKIAAIKKNQVHPKDDEVVENCGISLRNLKRALSCKSTAGRVIKANHFHPYKPTVLDKLKPGDFNIRFDFFAWYEGVHEDDLSLCKKIIFSGEVCFTLSS